LVGDAVKVIPVFEFNLHKVLLIRVSARSG
jgi:hypothetical protein